MSVHRPVVTTALRSFSTGKNEGRHTVPGTRVLVPVHIHRIPGTGNRYSVSYSTGIQCKYTAIRMVLTTVFFLRDRVEPHFLRGTQISHSASLHLKKCDTQCASNVHFT